jgi:hypothetical protein
MSTGAFVAIDAFFGSAPGLSGRRPDRLEGLYGDLLEAEVKADRRPVGRRELADLRARVNEALQSTDRGRRRRVSIRDDSFRVGSPDGVKRPPQPLRRHVDEWLADGGWTAGKTGAGSVALAEDDGDLVREHVRNRWREELRRRGWRGRWFHREWRVEPDGRGGVEVRMYWWRLPGPDHGPDVPPEPAADGAVERGENETDSSTDRKHDRVLPEDRKAEPWAR